MSDIATVARRRYEQSAREEATSLYVERKVEGYSYLHQQHEAVYGDVTSTGKDIRALLHRMIVREANQRPPEGEEKSPGMLERAFAYIVDRATGLREEKPSAPPPTFAEKLEAASARRAARNAR